MSNKLVCRCGKGRASPADNLCKHCREHVFPRRLTKLAGVSHSGDGISLDQADKLCDGQYVARMNDPTRTLPPYL